MANYQISATLNAQINGFRQNMTESERSATHAATSIDRSMGRIDASARRAGRGVAEAGQVARRSGTNWLELGRVLQDAPYGFSGVANNLTQLVPAAGAAGLAFSAVVSAITFAQTGTDNWTRGLSLNKKALDASKLAGEEYAATLDVVAQAQLKGSQNAAKELTELKTLYSVATNATIAYQQRKDAVDKLQEQYPKYFKNLSDESILAGRAKSAYDNLTESIIATARARAAQDLLVQGQTRQLENESKLVKLRDEYTEAIRMQGQAQQRLNKENESAGDRETAGLRGEASRNLTFWEEKRADIAKQITNIKSDSLILDKRSLDLTKSITSEVKKGADLADYVEKKRRGNTPVFEKTNFSKTRTQLPVDPTFATIQKKGIEDLLKPLNDYESGVAQFQNNLSDSQERAIAQMLDFNSTFQQTVEQLGSSTVVEGISNGFTAIGEALYSGADVFQAAGQAILQTVSGFLGELGNMLIQKGIATVAAGVALNFLAPGSGAKEIAGGLGLIAAGAALSVASGIGSAAASGSNKKKSNNVTAFANGGVVYGPTNALIGEYSGARNNPEVVAPLNKLKGMLGRDTFAPVLIPVINSKQLAILVKDGNDKLNRQ